MWWLAGMPKKTATPGTLVISPQRDIRLKLDTDMKTNIDWDRFWFDPTATLPFLRVFGELVSRRPTPVTLDRCFFTRDQFELFAHTALIGRQYRSNQPIALRDVRLELSHLDSWSAAHARNGLDLRWHFDSDSDDPPDDSSMYFAAEWRRPPPCLATLPDGTRIEVATELHEGTTGPAVLTASLKQYSRIRIRFPERRALEEVQRVVYNLRNFLALGAGTGIRVRSMFGHVDVVPRFPRDPFFQLTEIVYGMVEPDDVDEDPNPLGMLFVLSDVDDRFSEHINRWFEARERLGTVIDLYFSMLHARPKYPETQFLMYMQALEGYHRRTFERTAWPESEWAKVKTQLLSGLDAEYAKTLGGRRLEILNSPSLSARLSDLIKLCPKASRRILKAGGTTKGEFLEAAQATRNDQAHMFVERPDKAAHGIALIRLTAQVAALLEALLLRDVGLDDSDIGEMLWRGRRLDRMRIG